MNFGVYFYTQPFQEFSPLIMQLRFKAMVTSFLLRKKTNLTPYPPISYFRKENTPPFHTTMRIHHPYSDMKLLKPLITLPHLNIFNATFKNYGT